MILSANRFSSMNGNFMVAANESYGVNDFGRIMMENEANNMAIISAALMSDMHEIKGYSEGTMLESELQYFRENAIKEFGQKIIEGLKKFWAKLKGVFKAAIANISAYVVRDGKKFISVNRKALEKLKDSDKVGDIVAVRNKNGDRFLSRADFDIDMAKMKDLIKREANSDLSASDVCKKCLENALPGYDGDTMFVKAAFDYFFDKKTDATILDLGGKKSLMDTLEGGKDLIKEIKDMDNKCDEAIKKAIKDIKNETEREFELANRDKNADDYEKNKDEKNDKKKFWQAYASGLQSALTSISRVEIMLVKKQLKCARKALGRAIGKVAWEEGKNYGKFDSTLLESMLLEAEDEVDDAMNGETLEDLTPEEAEEAKEIIVAAIDAATEGDGVENECNY